MMLANQELSHSPSPSWIFYTPAGAAAAAISNLCLGCDYPTDPGGIQGFMLDPGSENTAAPHRRWFLYPRSVQLSTGNVQSSNYAFTSADATTAYDGNLNRPRPATCDPFVAWPPNGYFPEKELPDNSPFAVAGADF